MNTKKLKYKDRECKIPEEAQLDLYLWKQKQAGQSTSFN